MSRRISNHYQSLLDEHGDSHLSAQYSSKESQTRRFASLARITNLTGKRVLDFGCGTAAFAQYLTAIQQKPRVYRGVDIVPAFFDVARESYPQGVFSHPDDLGDERFDVALVSGVFNNRRRGNQVFWKDTVASLFERCDVGVAFNLMTTYVDYRDPGLFYEDPEAVFRYLKRNVTPFVTLLHDYLPKEGVIPFEFTVFAYRNPVDLELP